MKKDPTLGYVKSFVSLIPLVGTYINSLVDAVDSVEKFFSIKEKLVMKNALNIVKFTYT